MEYIVATRAKHTIDVIHCNNNVEYIVVTRAKHTIDVIHCDNNVRKGYLARNLSNDDTYLTRNLS